MPTTDRITRRSALAGLAAAAALVSASPARAVSIDAAKTLVAALAADLTNLVNSGRSANQLYGAFEGLLVRYGDMPAVAASVLGPPWRTADASQRRAFVAAFQTYLSRKYGAQFREFQNARIEVTGARDGGRAGVLVQTRVLRPGRESVAVDWQISDRSGSARVVNLVIEGVSMLATERAEIGARLEAARGDVSTLTAQLKAGT